MKTREEILVNAFSSDSYNESFDQKMLLILEVLLDCRDLLNKDL